MGVFKLCCIILATAPFVWPSRAMRRSDVSASENLRQILTEPVLGGAPYLQCCRITVFAPYRRGIFILFAFRAAMFSHDQDRQTIDLPESKGADLRCSGEVADDDAPAPTIAGGDKGSPQSIGTLSSPPAVIVARALRPRPVNAEPPRSCFCALHVIAVSILAVIAFASYDRQLRT